MELSLTCPQCGSTGLIPWDRLDRVLGCRGCSAFYRVEPLGLVEIDVPGENEISVEVRAGAGGEWHKHKAILSPEPTLTERIRDALREFPMTWRGRVAIAVAGLVLIWWTTTRFSHDDVALASTQLPDSLEERATLLAAAVARRDTGLLIQLTDPQQHRALRIWVAHGKDVPKSIEADDSELEPEIVSKVATGGSPNASTIRVRLRLPPDGEECILTQQWVRRADAWYFRPVVLRSQLPTKPSPMSNQRSRTR